MAEVSVASPTNSKPSPTSVNVFGLGTMTYGIFRFSNSSIFRSIPGTESEASTKSGCNSSTLSISISKSGPNLGNN